MVRLRTTRESSEEAGHSTGEPDPALDEYFDRLDAVLSTLEPGGLSLLRSETLRAPAQHGAIDELERAEDEWLDRPLPSVEVPRAEAHDMAPADLRLPPARLTEPTIEAIVQRVLSRLSERVIRDTVKHVLSEMVERLVREEVDDLRGPRGRSESSVRRAGL